MREQTEKENVQINKLSFFLSASFFLINIIYCIFLKSVWHNGRVSGYVYHGIISHQNLLNEAFGLYSLSNPLHPDVWPSATKYDSEIIAMTASLVKGANESVCGTTSSVQ